MLNLDTHMPIYALVGTLNEKEPRLLSENPWSISAIVLWELSKLLQLGRIDADLDQPKVGRALRRIHTRPLTLEIRHQSCQLDVRGDPADELIAATSFVENIPWATRDRVICRSKMIWFPGR
jgi:PIN domain nuclease of toxin-antitoxin system